MFFFKKDELSLHVMSHRIAVNDRRQLVQLNTSENSPSFPELNRTMQGNMKIDVQCNEVSNLLLVLSERMNLVNASEFLFVTAFCHSNGNSVSCGVFFFLGSFVHEVKA